MHWFLFFLSAPLFSSSAGRGDGVVWRNPLSRHFSFPLTDRPWRARAFGPPAWLAARQLNKPSSCYNSLKHFQLPESNKSSRQALGCSSMSNPTPQQVLILLSFTLSEDWTNNMEECLFSPSYGENKNSQTFVYHWRGTVSGLYCKCIIPLISHI